MSEGPPQGPPPPDDRESEARAEAEVLLRDMSEKWAALLARVRLSGAVEGAGAPEGKMAGSPAEKLLEKRLFRYLHEDYDPRVERHYDLLSATLPSTSHFSPAPGSPWHKAGHEADSGIVGMVELDMDPETGDRPDQRAKMMLMHLRALVLFRRYSTGRDISTGLKEEFLRDLAQMAERFDIEIPPALEVKAERKKWLKKDRVQKAYEKITERSRDRLAAEMKERLGVDSDAIQRTVADMAGLSSNLDDDLRDFFKDPDFRDDPGALFDLVLGEPPELAH